MVNHDIQSFLGGNLGPVTGMLLSGALTSAFGWEIVFYSLGSAVIVWFAFYIFLVYGEPSEHPRISQGRGLIMEFMDQSNLSFIMQEAADNEAWYSSIVSLLFFPGREAVHRRQHRRQGAALVESSPAALEEGPAERAGVGGAVRPRRLRVARLQRHDAHPHLPRQDPKRLSRHCKEGLSTNWL